jgi:hypothetical protein
MALILLDDYLERAFSAGTGKVVNSKRIELSGSMSLGVN